MPIPVITLTSDLGDQFAPSQMQLIVHSINPEVKFISAENNITPFSIIEGAFILSKLYGFAPRNSAHIAIIDPGVGSDRKGLVIKSHNHWFIGPDNGVLYPAAMHDGIEEVYWIHENTLGSISNTFHGRDVFAKAAANVISGISPLTFAHKIDVKAVTPLHFKKNQVLNIDPYGNIKFHAEPNGLKYGQKVSIGIKDKTITVPYCRTYDDVSAGELLLYHGSHQTLELGMNLKSAADYLSVNIGDIFHIANTRITM